MMFMNHSDITILNIHGVDYHCINNGISISDDMGLLKKCKLK